MKEQILEKIKLIKSKSKKIELMQERIRKIYALIDEAKQDKEKEISMLADPIIKEISELKKDDPMFREKAAEIIKQIEIIRDFLKKQYHYSREHGIERFHDDMHQLLDYLFEKEDVELISKYLCATTSYWFDISEERKLYKYKFRVYDSEKCRELPMLGAYKEYFDAIKLFEIHGKLDAIESQDSEKIYYSERAIQDLFKASTEEMGQMFSYIYGEPEFDRYALIKSDCCKAHDRAYKAYFEQLSSTQKPIKR